MRQFVQDAFQYVLHFIFMYVICCVVGGSILMLVGLGIGAILSFGFGLESIGDIGGAGIGLSVACLGSLLVALAGTFWAAPTERNVQRDFERLSRRMSGPYIPDLSDDSGKRTVGMPYYVPGRDRRGHDRPGSAIGAR